MRMTLLALCLATTPSPLPTVSTPPERPNVLLILADDQGYADLGFLGMEKDVRTPCIDALAARGTYFPNAYASSPICNPSRVGLMTGRYQQRWKNFFYGGGQGLPDQAVTLAERLQAAGYATGYFGKLHTGGPDNHPEAAGFPLNMGFDRFYGTTTGGRVHYLRHGKGAQEEFGEAAHQMSVGPLWSDREQVEFDGFTTEAFGEQARKFIAVERDAPFFAMVSFNAVHNFAWQLPDEELSARGLAKIPDWDPAKEEYKTWYARMHRRDWPEGRAYYLAQLECMDREVGRLLQTLEQLGIHKNTLVIYTVDNGGCVPDWANNGPLAGSKYHLLEGGTRTPTILRLPGQAPGARVDRGIFSGLDIAPTVCDLLGIETQPEDFDGISQLPGLIDESHSPTKRDLHWDIGWQWSIRSGDWKLMCTTNPNFAKHEANFEQVDVRQGTHLYNLRLDGGETDNQAERRPQLVEALRAKHAAWREQVGQPITAAK